VPRAAELDVGLQSAVASWPLHYLLGSREISVY
jgi:hypothetical protein